MKIVVQRVKRAKVEIDDKVVGKINRGLLLLVGIEEGDIKNKKEKIKKATEKILKMRIFSDENDKMNLSVQDINGEILVIPQFTLLADTTQGNRPFFGNAAPPQIAKPIFEKLVEELKRSELKVETGVFGAKMEVSLTNDGPVTIIV